MTFDEYVAANSEPVKAEVDQGSLYADLQCNRCTGEQYHDHCI